MHKTSGESPLQNAQLDAPCTELKEEHLQVYSSTGETPLQKAQRQNRPQEPKRRKASAQRAGGCFSPMYKVK